MKILSRTLVVLAAFTALAASAAASAQTQTFHFGEGQSGLSGHDARPSHPSPAPRRDVRHRAPSHHAVHRAPHRRPVQHGHRVDPYPHH